MIFDTNGDILLNGGSDSTDEILSPFVFFRIQMAANIGVFASCHFFNDELYGKIVKGMDPKSNISGCLNFTEVFPPWQDRRQNPC